MTESQIQDAIRLALGALPGCVFWRNNVGVAQHYDPRAQRVQVVRYGLAPGSADLVGLVRGRFVALEVKAPGGRVSPEQTQWLACVRANGGVAVVVHSVDEALSAISAID